MKITKDYLRQVIRESLEEQSDELNKQMQISKAAQLASRGKSPDPMLELTGMATEQIIEKIKDELQKQHTSDLSKSMYLQLLKVLENK